MVFDHIIIISLKTGTYIWDIGAKYEYSKRATKNIKHLCVLITSWVAKTQIFPEFLKFKK